MPHQLAIQRTQKQYTWDWPHITPSGPIRPRVFLTTPSHCTAKCMIKSSTTGQIILRPYSQMIHYKQIAQPTLSVVVPFGLQMELTSRRIQSDLLCRCLHICTRTRASRKKKRGEGWTAFQTQQQMQDRYMNATETSLLFILQYLLSPDNSSVYNSFTLENCSADSTTAPLSYNSGWLIEGMSVLANITQNSTLTMQLQSLVSSMANNPNWTDPAGVLNEINVDSNPQVQTVELKSILVRGLTEAYNRNRSDYGLIDYIGAFISIQYNTVLTNATSNQSNGYSASWLGPSTTSPPSGNFTTGNIMALDVLNAGFLFAQQGSYTFDPAPQSTSPLIHETGLSNPPSNHYERGHSNIKVLVGCTVGGAITSAILVAGLLFIRRKRAAKARMFSLDDRFLRSSTQIASYLKPTFTTAGDRRNTHLQSRESSTTQGRATITTTTSNTETRILNLHAFPSPTGGVWNREMMDIISRPDSPVNYSFASYLDEEGGK